MQPFVQKPDGEQNQGELCKTFECFGHFQSPIPLFHDRTKAITTQNQIEKGRVKARTGMKVKNIPILAGHVSCRPA